MSESDTVWAALILAGAAYEAYALADRGKGNTLSEATRSLFRVHTRGGAVLFGALWLSFSCWFFGHILWGWPFPGF